MEITDVLLAIMVMTAIGVGIWAYWKGYDQGYEDGKIAMKEKMERKEKRKTEKS